jgi:homoserine O-acetyltransferase
VSPGGGVDLDRYCVLGLDFAPLGDRRVRITPDDQARLIEVALDHLGVAALHAFVGSSYGAMVGMALAQRAPERVRRLCVISASCRPSALGLAWRGVQRRMVEFGLAHGDAEGGLSLARQLAMTTYRSDAEFAARFGAGLGADGLGEVDRYLIARGQAYPSVMAPRRWLSLSEAIDRHDVDPARIRAPTTLVACPTDQLAPIAEMEELSRRLPRLRAFHTLPSIYGHDAFLKEAAALRPILSAALEAPSHA